MARSNFRRNLVISVIGVTVIGALVLYFPQLQQVQIQPNEISVRIQQDTFPELSFTGTTIGYIDCFIKTATIVEYTNGRKVEVTRSGFVGGDIGVSPVALELVSRTTQEVFKNVIVEGRIRCDMANVAQDGNPTSPSSTMYGWTLYPSNVVLFTETDNLDGKPLLIPQIEKRTSQIGLRDNEEFTFVSFTIPASQIDALYSQYIQEYKVEFRSDLIGDLRFAFNVAPAQQYQIKFGNQQLHSSFFYNVRKIAPVTTPITLANEYIEISSIQRTIDGLRLENGINKFDTSMVTGSQVKITGKVKTWDQSQGNPNIKMTFGSSTIVEGRMSFDHTENDNKDGIFIFFYAFPKNSAEGQYNVLMTMTGRTVVSTRTIIVDNSEPSTTSDTDKDGVLDASDKCPNLVGVVQYFGCPPPTTPKITNQTTPTPTPEDEKILINKLLQGKVKNLATIFFKDGTKNAYVGGEQGFLTGTATITPLELTANIAGDEKAVDRIEYEVFYTYENIEDGIATFLVESKIRFTPTVIVSSVQQKTGTFIPQEGAILQNGKAINNIGFGLSLGKGIIETATIQGLTTEFITKGQARDVQLNITATGDFTLKRDTLSHEFNLKGAFVTFKELNVNNQVTPIAKPESCPSGTVATFNDFGEFVSCQPITEDTKRCTTPERTINCEQTYIDAFCENGNVNQCREPDEDVDFVPDYRDACLDDREDGKGDSTEEMTDGCPIGITGGGGDGEVPKCSKIVDGICVIILEKPDSNGGSACSKTNPEACNPTIDTQTILFIGGIIFVVIALVILIARRR